MAHRAKKIVYDYIKSLKIPSCDVYLEQPQIVGNQENRQKSYITIGFPNGIDDHGAFISGTGVIAIGTKDKKDTLGLPNELEMQRIEQKLKSAFPYLTNNCSIIDFEFSSDEGAGIGWKEYYYTFRIYIN